MNTFFSVIAALIVLGVIITGHELGHFLVGKKLGFTITDFSVGMGPVLLQKKHQGVRYCLRAIPIGGSCMFLGEDEPASEGTSFNAQAAWKRFLVILAGPMMNVLMAFLLSFVAVLSFGGAVPMVQEVIDEKPASVAGLLPGDILCGLNGEEIDTIQGFTDALSKADPDRIIVSVERDGQRLQLEVRDAFDEELQTVRIGITVGLTRVRFGVARSVTESVRSIGSIVKETFSFFGVLFRGEAKSTDVSGVVGTVAIMSSYMRYGLEVILQLGVLINVSLAFMNLLPLPALDGGRLVFILVEWIRGKPIDREKEGMVHFIGIILLLALMVFLTFNDIRNLMGS